VARNAGKVVFVEGALAGELVEARLLEARSKFDLARAMEILRPSASRRAPLCPYFGVCGGCATQHVEARTQVAAKQRWLEDNLARIGKVSAEADAAPIHGQEWGYRHRARLSVRYVEGKGGALVGFPRAQVHLRRRHAGCEVLPPGISALMPLRSLISQLSIRDRVPQVEIAVGENATVLLFRHLLPLTVADQDCWRPSLRRTACAYGSSPKGPTARVPFIRRCMRTCITRCRSSA
jgi:23S rRNA (uracil1939-C5)-methyltransferase